MDSHTTRFQGSQSRFQVELEMPYRFQTFQLTKRLPSDTYRPYTEKKTAKIRKKTVNAVAIRFPTGSNHANGGSR